MHVVRAIVGCVEEEDNGGSFTLTAARVAAGAVTAKAAAGESREPVAIARSSVVVTNVGYLTQLNHNAQNYQYVYYTQSNVLESKHVF